MPNQTPNPTVKLETITPDLAEKLLQRSHERQRGLSEKAVAAYAHDMTSGRWEITGDTIKIDPEGAVIDGQHPLHAIIRSGVPAQMFVARNIATDVFAVLDQGRKRSFADYLAGLKVDNYVIVATAVGKIAYYKIGRRFEYVLHQTNSFTISDLITVWETEPGISTWAKSAGAIGSRFRFSPGILCAFFYAADVSKAGDVHTFANQVLSGVDLGPQDPAGLLRNTLLDRLATRGERRYSNEYYTHTLIRAWNAYARGEELKILKGSISGKPVQMFDPHGFIDQRWPQTP
jgi:hypothetical protein